MNRFLVILILGMVVAGLVSSTLQPASASWQAEPTKEFDSLVERWRGSGNIEIVPVQHRAFAKTGSFQGELARLIMLVERMGSRRLPSGQDAVRHNVPATVSYDEEVRVFHWRLTLPPDQGSSISTRKPR